MAKLLVHEALAAEIATLATPDTPKPGRPTALTETQKIATFLAALSDGCSRVAACQLAGMSTNTLTAILRQADEGRPAPQAFQRALNKMEASVEQGLVRKVIRAAEDPRFWAAGMTYLERKHPERWGRRSEDSSTPRVVVQIGASDSDVRVLVAPGAETPALPAPAETEE